MHYTPGETRLARVSVGAVFGAAAALLLGMLIVMTIPDGELADLVATAATRVVPLGMVVGAVLGYRTWHA
jgi:hypothetical protein